MWGTGEHPVKIRSKQGSDSANNKPWRSMLSIWGLWWNLLGFGNTTPLSLLPLAHVTFLRQTPPHTFSFPCQTCHGSGMPITLGFTFTASSNGPLGLLIENIALPRIASLQKFPGTWVPVFLWLILYYILHIFRTSSCGRCSRILFPDPNVAWHSCHSCPLCALVAKSKTMLP